MSSSQARVMLVYGTRPEAVKMAPVVRALTDSHDFEPIVVVTGQHREMLDQVNEVFGITPDYDLDMCSPGQTLTDITNRTLRGMEHVLAREKPDLVIVQGDTTTSTSAALAAFYADIPVVHLEAGLRTDNPRSPFPEEINRRVTTQLASLNLAPTATSRENLLKENVNPSQIVVTGNTVIDALHWTVGRNLPYGDDRLDAELDESPTPVLLVTAHRRESWGEPMREIGRAIARLAIAHPKTRIVFPIHPNPVVRNAMPPLLFHLPNVLITEPLPYGGFCRLMARADVILTDSGGVQEEGPSLGVPVLVMRDTTERPEAVEAGTVKLVGTDEDVIVRQVSLLLTDWAARAEMAKAVNPYGDGRAAERTVMALLHHLGLGDRPAEFTPSAASASTRQDDPEGVLV